MRVARMGYTQGVTKKDNKGRGHFIVGAGADCICYNCPWYINQT
jgi:hypothetical protein